MVLVESFERNFAVFLLNGEFYFSLTVYIVKPRCSLSSCVILPHSNSKRNM